MAPELYSIADGNVAGCCARQHRGFGISAGRVFLVAPAGLRSTRPPVETRLPASPDGRAKTETGQAPSLQISPASANDGRAGRMPRRSQSPQRNKMGPLVHRPSKALL